MQAQCPQLYISLGSMRVHGVSVCKHCESVSKSVCVCLCKGAVLGAEVTPELQRQVFQGLEAVQLYETSAYVG